MAKKKSWLLLAGLAGVAWWFMGRKKPASVPTTNPIVPSTSLWFSVMVEDQWLKSFTDPAEAEQYAIDQGLQDKAIIYTVMNGQVVPDSGVYA